MRIIKLSKSNSSEIIKAAINALRAGGVIVYPTETAYGFGADFLNYEAVKKVYKIKNRDIKKPLSAIVADLKMAKKFVKFNEIALKFAKKYWPGPLTLVLNSKFLISNEFKISNYTNLALRVSSNKIATAIVKKFGSPITATSANISGKGELYSASGIIKQFEKRKFKPDLIIDAGLLPKCGVSTIIKVKNNKVDVLRQGRIKLNVSRI